MSIKAERLYATKSGFELFYYSTKRVRLDNPDDEFLALSYKIDHGEIMTGSDKDDYWSSRDLERNDPTLIEVVEELGEEASGRCAKLRIVEIPDNADWEIDEYDGMEHVAEKHRSWS